MEKRKGDRKMGDSHSRQERGWGRGRGWPILPKAILQQLCPGLEQGKPPCPHPGCSARAFALPLSYSPPQQDLPADTPSWGGVEPCSLELLRQTGRVPGAMLLGNMAQGPSLSPEPPPRVGLGTHWGPTWGPDPPSSHLAQPWQASSLYSLDPCTTRSLKGRENSFAEHHCLPGLPSSFPRSWILAYSGETLNS